MSDGLGCGRRGCATRNFGSVTGGRSCPGGRRGSTLSSTGCSRCGVAITSPPMRNHQGDGRRRGLQHDGRPPRRGFRRARGAFVRCSREAVLEPLRGEDDQIARHGRDGDVGRVGSPADREERQRFDREGEPRAGQRRDPARRAIATGRHRDPDEDAHGDVQACVQQQALHRFGLGRVVVVVEGQEAQRLQFLDGGPGRIESRRHQALHGKREQ